MKEKLGSYGKCKKNEVWQRLGQVMTKNAFAHKILDEVFGGK